MASSNKSEFSAKVLPQAAKLPGTSGFLRKKLIFWKKFCPRQRSCPGQVACSKKTYFLRNVLPQAAKLPGTSGLLKKESVFENKLCPRQRSCPGQVACSKKSHVFKTSSAPGSEAARDKLLVKKNVRLLRKSSAPRPAQRARHTCLGLQV